MYVQSMYMKCITNLILELAHIQVVNSVAFWNELWQVNK
jgi:hypothetical protein